MACTLVVFFNNFNNCDLVIKNKTGFNLLLLNTTTTQLL